MEIESILVTGAVAVGAWRRLCISVFDDRLDVATITRLREESDSWFERNSGQVVHLTVVYPSPYRLVGEERRAVVELIRAHEHLRLATATVLLATGLEGSLHRSILTGITLLARPPHPAKVAATVAEGANWLRPHLEVACGELPPPGALDNCVEELHASLVARRTAVGP